MDYLIDKGIPVPLDVQPNGVGRGNKAKYPLHVLKPGESFYIKLEDAHKRKNLRSSMATRAKKLNITIVSVADDTGVRVWRTI